MSEGTFSVSIDEMAEKPPMLPAGDYPAIVSMREKGKSKNKQSPYERITVVLQGWPEGIDQDTRRRIGSIHGKVLYKDYWKASEEKGGRWDYRLGVLLKQLGFSGDAELALSRIQGARVLAVVKHRRVTKDRNGELLTSEKQYDIVEIDELIGVEA